MSIRTYPDIPRIYLDMDGVIADFGASMKNHKLTPHELKMMPGAYLSLPKIVSAYWGIKQLHEMNKFFLMILTKIPSQNPYAASEKILWMKRELPSFMKDHIIITPDKGCVGTSRDFLVDDHPEWANASRFPGTVIKFGGDQDDRFNHVKDWDSLVRFFKDRSES